jgi:glucokinase
MILAGDIGGTKTVLALFPTEGDGVANAVHETRFPSADHASLEAIIERFLADTGATPLAASFGLAGPVNGRRANITNLPWNINADSIAERFNIPKVFLLNDLEAIATAVPHLQGDDLHTLHPGHPVANGNRAVVAPGTGLGIAASLFNGSGYNAFPTEAGHSSFAPRSSEQVALLEYLQQRHGHVSFERVCSGKYLPGIYDFLLEQGKHQQPDWLKDELAAVTDRTPIIVQAALKHQADICDATLDLFVRVLGTITGNVALSFLATGGLYLGGGIPPRILKRLKQPDFSAAVTDKGRFSELCGAMPIHVILDPKVALHGAAWAGLEALQQPVS